MDRQDAKLWRCADVTSKEQLEETFLKAISEMGRIHILVNNAGMNIRTPALEVTDEQWETIMQTNLKSAFSLHNWLVNI